MRKSSLYFLFTLTYLNLFSQNIVTRVTGKIKKTDGIYVRIGTILTEKEVLRFSSKEDILRMIVPGKGTFTVSPSNAAKKKKNEWIEILSNTKRVKDSVSSINYRAALYEKIPAAFETIIKINTHTIISNSQPNKFLFNPAEYDLSNGSRFVLQIEQNNIPTLQRLRTSNDTLLLYRSDFQTDIIGSKSVTYTIGFYDKLKKQTLEISKLTPYFDDAGEMEAIIHTLISSNKNKTITTQQELIYNEIYKVLGKPSDILFYSTFDKIMQEINNPVTIITITKKGLKEEIESYERIAKLSVNTMRDQIDLPAQFSLRQYTPPVQSQGDYGTCVAWSSAYAARTVAWAVSKNYNNIDDAASISKYSFSPQFLFLNIKSPEDKQCEDGTTLVNALKFMKEKGVITWDNSTYDCSILFSQDDIKNAEQYKIKDFLRLSSWFNIQDSTILNMKRSLAEKKPLIVGMHLPNSFNTVDRKTGIWYPNPEDYEKAINAKNISGKYSGHAMCIIGYNDAVNGGSFEIMNSWGKDSGKDGFYWVSYDDMKKFGSQVLILNDSTTEK